MVSEYSDRSGAVIFDGFALIFQEWRGRWAFHWDAGGRWLPVRPGLA